MTLRRWQREDPSQKGGILFSLVTLVAVLIVLVVLYLARHPILRLVGEGWDRATRASQVYRQGLGPVVVASGRRLRPYAGIAELMEHDLIERGVPKDKILRVAHDSDNTREEAETLVQVAKQKKWHSVIVVTSNYHTRRVRYIFSRIFPEDIKTRITGALDDDFDPERWWEKRISVKKFVREMAAMVVAIWEQHVGSDIADKSQVIVASSAQKTLGVV